MPLLADEHLGVAVVDDDQVYRDLTCALITSKTPFVPFPIANGAGLFDLLTRQRIDCIVLDYDLGDDTGLSIKSRLDQQCADAPPVIMLTGDGRESTAIKAFRMGVNDYLPKSSLQPKALVSTILNVVSVERQRLLARAEHQRLAEASQIDFVSGLSGRSHLDARLTQLAGLDPAARRAYALVLIELVQYQAITEQRGFKTGDLALRIFSKGLQSSTRSHDIVGRYEGGKFLVISNVASDPAKLAGLCKRLSQNLQMTCEAETAKLELSGSVAGAMCTACGEEESAAGPPFHALIESLKQSRSPSGSYMVLASADPVGAPEEDRPAKLGQAGVANERIVLPAAEQLRATDRRRESRNRVLKRGVIHVAASQATFNCIVRNVSAGGAGLRVDAPFAVPTSFLLEIVGSSERRPVVVRWQNGVDLGVELAISVLMQAGDRGH